MLELDVSKQRLDSTHIESSMAKFGRMKLMATAIRRFLVQLRRHDESSSNALWKAVRERYEATDSAVFGWKTLDDDGVNQLRQSIAEDLVYLVERYRRNKDHNSRLTYLMLVRVFEHQCDVVDEKVVVKKHTGGDIVCNLSNPDATFDGHKGSGYQVLLSETCSPDNDVQLIVSAIPETAVKSDSAALEIVIDDLKERGLLPDRLLADTAYGSDDNDILCRSKNISLVSSTSGKCPADHVDPDAITVSAFRIDEGEAKDEYGRTIIVPTCVKCPAGQKPHRLFYDDFLKQINIRQHPHVCAACPLL